MEWMRKEARLGKQHGATGRMLTLKRIARKYMRLIDLSWKGNLHRVIGVRDKKI